MADNNELKTDRLSGAADDGLDLAASWPNFELALRTIFGVPVDTAMSEALQMAVGPDITMTGTLTLRAAPTTDLMAATKAYLQSQASGVGMIRSRAYLTSDQTLVWPGGGHFISFDNADINEGSVWSAVNPSRFTIPVGGAGDYLFGMSASFDSAYGDSQGWFYAYVNRTDRYTFLYEEQGIETEVACSGLVYIPSLAEGDYIELNLYPRTYADNTLYKANTTMWMFNLE